MTLNLMPSSNQAQYSFLNLFKNNSLISKKLLLIFIGAVYPMGFSPIDFWPFTFLSIMLLINELIVCCDNQQLEDQNADAGKKGQLSLFQTAFYWSFGAFGVGVSWVYVSIHEFGHVPIIGAIAISLLLVITLSIIKASGFYLVGKMSKYLGNHFIVLIVPFLWVIFEFVQTNIFSGFPWLFAGYSQIDGPLWMLATWFGVYGVSWFMLAIASCLVVLIRFYLVTKYFGKNLFYKELLFNPITVVLVLFISIPVIVTFTPSKQNIPTKSSIDVALVQPNIAQEKKWDRRFFSQILNVLYQQSEEHWNADLLVWPEGAIPAYKHQVNDIIDDLNQRSKTSQTDLLLGLPVYQAEQKISYAAFLSLGEQQHTYHKQVLVPFGEYVPLGELLRGLIRFLDLPMSSFSPAKTKQQPMQFDDYQVVPAICYEITYPNIVHDLVTSTMPQKPVLLVTVSNDAWFGDSFGPYQHMQMARMRALELGIPLVRSTNDGISAIVDARGKIVSKLERFTQATLRAEVPLNNYSTLYRKYGLLGVYLILSMSSIIFMLALVIARIKDKK